MGMETLYMLLIAVVGGAVGTWSFRRRHYPIDLQRQGIFAAVFVIVGSLTSLWHAGPIWFYISLFITVMSATLLLDIWFRDRGNSHGAAT